MLLSDDMMVDTMNFDHPWLFIRPVFTPKMSTSTIGRATYKLHLKVFNIEGYATSATEEMSYPCFE